MPIVELVVLIVIILLIFDFYQRFQKPSISTRSWPEFATRAGLIYEPPTGSWSDRRQPRVAGKYRGYELKLDIVRAISGAVDDGIATYHTRLVLSFNHPITGSLSLNRQWLLFRGEIKLGDEQFDRRFVIESHPKDFVARVFASAELRQQLVHMGVRKFKLSTLGLRLETKDIESNIERIYLLFDLACDIAETAERISRLK